MSQRIINIGTGPNTKDGDTVRQAFNLTNQNFTELYTLVGNGLVQTTVLVPSDTPTVVWESSNEFVTGAKLIFQVEGSESPDAGGAENWHTQMCEAHVAKRLNFTTAPVISVYGITYTSVSPLATFTAQYDLQLNTMKVIATATNAGYLLHIKVYATEFSTSD